jgi:type IV pilus assembly protein PilB
MSKMMLGELLVSAGLVGEEQVLAAVRAQRGSGLPLGHYLVRSGILREDQLLRVLSQQLQVPIVDLDALSVHDDALKKVPAEYCKANLVVPYRVDGRVLVVATADPTRDEVLDHLRVTTFCDVRFSLATPSAIDRALERAYDGGMPPGASVAAAPAAAPAPAALEQRLARLETAVSMLIDMLAGHELLRKEDFPLLSKGE